ncbi:MAG: hypothetical protein M3010_04685, partial [Candidatus Dormibacteraeota bacterium]|nr:hypothetical protein [Candidatus Dormibacteraeota bacterium]
LAESLADREMAFRGHHLRLMGLLELGDTAQIDTEISACAALARQLRMPLYSWQVNVFEGMRAFLDGDFRRADRAAEAGMEAGKGIVDDPAMIAVATQTFMQKWLRGGLEELEGAVQDMVTTYPDVPAWRSALALYHAELGREQEARWELAQFARQGFALFPRDRNWLAGVCLLAYAAHRIGDAEHSATLYDLLRRYPGRGVVVGAGAVVMGDSSQYLGMLAETLGRFQEARRHYQEALGRLRSGGNRPFFIDCLYRYGALLLANGDSSDAAKGLAALQEALDVATSLELERYILLCQDRLAAAGGGEAADEQEDRLPGYG